MSATPRPWKQTGHMVESVNGQGDIAKCYGFEETREANAALIVRAVNQHDRAKAELRNAVRRLSDLTTELEDSSYTGGSEAVVHIASCLDALIAEMEG